ncbi:MAG TPA: rhodanese-like domain-containing protein [Anaerolineaceae bacterium]|nr:rhodanese-like domain-containing protein [Anaerolineaceae bacterium]
MSKKINVKQQEKKQKWLLPLILVGLAVIVGAVFLLSNNTEAKGMPGAITVTDAAQRFDQGAFLLDVRTVEEWNQGHIDGAVLIPLDQLSGRINELPADQDVLIICRSGNRSGQARDLLRAAGLKRTTSISGGINAWIAKGLPVVTGP